MIKITQITYLLEIEISYLKNKNVYLQAVNYFE